MKFSINTLGCKVNQSESDVIEGNLIERGHSVVSLSEKPEYCIVNTCSVTAKSDYQSRQLIRRVLRVSANVIATGCYAQLRPEDIRGINRDIQIVRNADKYNIINLLDDNISDISLCYSNKSRPCVKVQDGCNNACTFCIVPLARGKSRSIEKQVIIDQIIGLEEKGYSEIVLTGVHLGSYGRDLKHKLMLSDLVKTILNETNIKRIRFSSLGIHEIDQEILKLLREKRICNHLHIPLQSGDDSILRKMKRRYDASSYRSKIFEIISEKPDISIGTDVIVGFPGETAEAFLNTEKLIEQIPFAYMHIFPYSSRPGSGASQMADHIEFSVKKKRYDLLRGLNNKKRGAFLSSQIDRVLEIVIEDEDTDHRVVGTSSNYLKVSVDTNYYSKKSLVAVRVTGREGDTLIGEPVNKRYPINNKEYNFCVKHNQTRSNTER
jgi:threonylcarbamoyladenosine tRNA methylthiotransferase MtaB